MSHTNKPYLLPEYEIRDQLADLSIDQLIASIQRCAQEFPVHQVIPVEQQAKDQFSEVAPSGMPLSDVVDKLLGLVDGHYRKNAHPGMMAYIAGSGMPTDPIAYAMVAAWNQNVTGEHSAPAMAWLERCLTEILLKLAGFPLTAVGIMTSGGAMSNLTALSIALARAFGNDYLDYGLKHQPAPVILGTAQTHFTIKRACRILGVGELAFETLPTDAHHAMQTDALQQRLAELQAESTQRAVCVVATAGTTSTGAIDPLHDISCLCEENNVWMHVDAAYGAAALLSDKSRGLLEGIQLADSISIDLHKWFYQSIDSGILLLKDDQDARAMFAVDADYVQKEAVKQDRLTSYFDLSIEVSRRARSIPPLLAFHHYGLKKLGMNVQYNIDCIDYLAALVKASDNLEMLNCPQLSIGCFRYKGKTSELTVERLNSINTAIIKALNEEQNFHISPTSMDGRVVIRLCICNYNTRASHIEMIVEDVLRLAAIAHLKSES